jgi:hypothetical protein
MRPDVKSFRLLASSLRQLLELRDLMAGVVAESSGPAEEEAEQEEPQGEEGQGVGGPRVADAGVEHKLGWAQAGIAHKVGCRARVLYPLADHSAPSHPALS